MLTQRDLGKIDGIVVKRVDEVITKRVDEIVTRRLKPIQKQLSKIQKDLKTSTDFLDRENLHTVRRVDRVEQHLKLPPLNSFA